MKINLKHVSLFTVFMLLTLALSLSGAYGMGGSHPPTLPANGISITVGTGPYAFAFDSYLNEIFVANIGVWPPGTGNTVSVIPDSGRYADTVIATITVGTAPFALAFDPHNYKVYVANVDSSTVSVISDATNTVTKTITLPSGSCPDGVGFDSNLNEIFIADGCLNTMYVIADLTNTVIKTITISGPPEGYPSPTGIAFDPHNNEVYEGDTGAYGGGYTVHVISDATNTVIAIINVGWEPYQVGFDSHNNELYVTNLVSSTVSVISDSTNTVIATIPVQAEPCGVAFDSHNDHVYVVNFGSYSASVISTTNTVIRTIVQFTAPEAIVFDSHTTQLFVANYGLNTVSVIPG